MLLPPPNCVRKPKHETLSLLDLYSSPSLERSSSLETFARPGWRTSLLSRRKWNSQYFVCICAVVIVRRWRSVVGWCRDLMVSVGSEGRFDVHDHLLAAQQRVADELARAQGDLAFRHDCGVSRGCLLSGWRDSAVARKPFSVGGERLRRIVNRSWWCVLAQSGASGITLGFLSSCTPAPHGWTSTGLCLLMILSYN